MTWQITSIKVCHVDHTTPTRQSQDFTNTFLSLLLMSYRQFHKILPNLNLYAPISPKWTRQRQLSIFLPIHPSIHPFIYLSLSLCKYIYIYGCMYAQVFYAVHTFKKSAWLCKGNESARRNRSCTWVCCARESCCRRICSQQRLRPDCNANLTQLKWANDTATWFASLQTWNS